MSRGFVEVGRGNTGRVALPPAVVRAGAVGPPLPDPAGTKGALLDGFDALGTMVAASSCSSVGEEGTSAGALEARVALIVPEVDCGCAAGSFLPIIVVQLSSDMIFTIEAALSKWCFWTRSEGESLLERVSKL